jgi:GDPmannose 4,6-dehydratase
MNPVTPYGVAKAFATQMVRVYRQAHGFFACNAICYNHESPRRGESFVTRKITRGVARIKLGLQKTITLGNIDSSRDWGFAKDYVEAMWRMLQGDQPNDYILATGLPHTVRDFLESAFATVDLPLEPHIIISPQLYRPLEVTSLVGNPSKAKLDLGWEATTPFSSLVQLMVNHDLQDLSRPH